MYIAYISIPYLFFHLEFLYNIVAWTTHYSDFRDLTGSERNERQASQIEKIWVTIALVKFTAHTEWLVYMIDV